MGRRVVLARLRDSANLGIIAVGVVQFEEADATKNYTATITIKENGVDLGTQTITLPAGEARAELPAASPAVDEMSIRKNTLNSGAIEIVARYRYFNVAGSAAEVYDVIGRMEEAGTNVVSGQGTIRFN